MSGRGRAWRSTGMRKMDILLNAPIIRVVSCECSALISIGHIGGHVGATWERGVGVDCRVPLLGFLRSWCFVHMIVTEG